MQRLASVLALRVPAAAVIAVVSLAPVHVGSQAPTATTQGRADIASLRTPWGEPDLQGIWNGQTLTPVERPARFAGKLVLTEEEEARLIEQMFSRPNRERRATRGTEKDVAGAYNTLFLEGATRLTEGRTALIVDPPDGRIPPLTPEAKQRMDAYREFQLALLQATETCRNQEFACRGGKYGPPSPRRAESPPGGYNTGRFNRADDPEDRSLAERCLGGGLPTWGGSGLGAYIQIVQSPKSVAIFYDTGQGQGFNRIIPVDGSPHLPDDVRLWWGDARGRWDGSTLVVDTTNFSHQTNFRGSREHLHLVERFTRVDANTLKYEVTMDDPTTWTRPWTVAISWPKDSDKANRIYEPTCHPGNYGLTGLLSGARASDRAFAEGRGPDPATLDSHTGVAEMDVLDSIAREREE